MVQYNTGMKIAGSGSVRGTDPQIQIRTKMSWIRIRNIKIFRKSQTSSSFRGVQIFKSVYFF
jgi:hypothetical protein